MIRNSLTGKIILPVSVVITIAIGIYTFIIVKDQTEELRKRATLNGVYISHLIYQNIRQVMLTGKHEETEKFFLNMVRSWEIQRAFVFDEEGKIVFSSEEGDVGDRADGFHRRLFAKSAEPIKVEVSEDQKTLSVVKTIKNHRECQRCHRTDRPILGALGLDISLVPAEKEITKSRNRIIIFALIILILVSAVVSTLIVILVTYPIRNLVATMTKVEQGNLKARVDVRSKDELGLLGESFNSMITRLDQLGAELQKQHEQQIQQAEKMATIGELASGIAHEIRNPLAGISAAIQVLAKELKLDPAYREVMDEIMRQLERLDKNTKDLLSFAKPAEVKFLEGDINEVISSAIFFIRTQAEKQGIYINEDLEPGMPKINIDPMKMQQVFLNVMLNAVQAMPAGGSLSIVSRISENIENRYRKNVELSFIDTGKGITKEQLKKIFDPFFTTKHRGTGLGLSICWNTVKKHGGHIEVNSNSQRGTSITIVLPVNEEG